MGCVGRGIVLPERGSDRWRNEAKRIPLGITQRSVVVANSKTFIADHLWIEGVVGAGVDYRFTSRLSLLIQPTASYSFYKPAVNPASQTLNYKAYSFGTQTQLIWRL